MQEMENELTQLRSRQAELEGENVFLRNALKE